MKKITGIGASRGVAIGRLHFFDNAARRVEPCKAEHPEEEFKRFETARLQAIEKLGELHDKAMGEVGPEESMIFEIHQMMLEDDDYIDGVKAQIEQGFVAEYAVQTAGEQLAGVFALMDDAYMKERAADVLDISNRVVRVLCGEESTDLSGQEGLLIIAAKDLLPSETIQMDQTKVQALITSAGSKISHASILARTMGIPAVVGLGDDQLSQLRDGDLVVVDGFNGVVLMNPEQEMLAEYEQKRQEYISYKERLKKLKGTESKTQDGVSVEICANIGHPSDVVAALENDAQGVGLFRSEFLYMESDDFPTEDAQYAAYREVLEKMGPSRRVIVRTLDLGADKTAPYFNMPREDNPAMGYRAIRICLRQKDIFKTQLRALLRASVYGKLAIMFPMITSVEEVQEIKAVLEECKKELDAEGVKYSGSIEVGIMVETPAAAVISDLLAKEVDFFSIGTNDLTQYTLAVDRMNSNIGAMYDPRHRAVLRLMRMTAENAVKNGIWCGICGESGADRKLTEAFLAMGVTELSVTPTAILEVKEKIQSINLSTQKESVLERI